MPVMTLVECLFLKPAGSRDGVVRELISNSDPCVRDNLECTALDVAVAGDDLNSETVRLLAQNEMEPVNTPNNKGDCQ